MVSEPTKAAMRCLHCGYRLDGLAGTRCPECGGAYDATDPRTFDSDERAMRHAKAYLTGAWVCTSYAGLILLAMMIGVAASLAEIGEVVVVAGLAVFLLACCSPVVMLVQMTMLICALVAARHARVDVWPKWWLALVVGIAAWCGAVITLLML